MSEWAKNKFLRSAVVFLFFFPVSFPVSAATGTQVMVATADAYATEVAKEVLRQGGNAVDAAVAAQWVLNVVEPQSSGIGGGGFFLYYEASSKKIYAFDGREKAPSKAFPEMFLEKNGQPCTFDPDCNTGGLAAGVPGTLKLLHTVHSRLGSKEFSFAELFEPALQLAQQGFPVSARLSHYIAQEKDRLKIFPAAKAVFLDSNLEPLKPGAILKQPDLAKTFRILQRDGLPAFYEGEIAKAIVDAVHNSPFHPGLMSKDDLFYYKIIEREPLHGNYRGYDIFTMAPPSSGGSTLLETLNILENYRLDLHGRNAVGFHYLIEAQKLAFRDRNQYVADPDFVKIPLESLLSSDHGHKLASQIQFNEAMPSTEASVRPLRLENSHTSHISIVDSQGNMVAYTTTIEYFFGCALMVPGYGFFLNNELTDFDLNPRDLTGKLTANAPAADKRPRSSMTPTFVFSNGEPFLILGSPGGSKIIGAVLNVLVNVIDFKMSLKDALAAPRMINRDGPVEVEPHFLDNADTHRELQRRGHPFVEVPAIGNVQAIHFDPESQLIVGESDPRGDGQADGY